MRAGGAGRVFYRLMDNIIAQCYFRQKNDKKHFTYFTPHWLYVINGKHRWRFENEYVTQIEFDEHKLLIPLIAGGIMTSFASLMILRDLLEPFTMLVLLLAGFFLMYYGWSGASVMVVHEGKSSTKIYPKQISQNLKDYIHFYRSYVKDHQQGLIIYHIADRSTWHPDEQYYEHPSLQQEGFIHTSRREQLLPTFERYFPGKGQYVLLEINSLKLTSALKYEHVGDRNQTFPHIYGKINKESVLSAIKFKDRDELIGLLNT